MTGIIPFSYMLNPGIISGSTFLRVDRLVANDSGFEKYIHGKKYDSLIFQKAYWREMMKMFDGPKILDICDPDWFNIHCDYHVTETGRLADAITCSSERLTNLAKNIFPDKIVVHIPDRLDFNLFPPVRKEHRGTARKAVWFGFIHNAFETLHQLIPAIREYRLHLHIIADRPYTKDDEVLKLNPEYIRYNRDTVYEYLQQADIVLNPESGKAFYKYKSDNKSVIAWKLGLPVAVTPEDIARLLDPGERNKEVALKQPFVAQEYPISKSVEQYRRIISRVRRRFR
jgi:hypothetical protein